MHSDFPAVFSRRVGSSTSFPSQRQVGTSCFSRRVSPFPLTRLPLQNVTFGMHPRSLYCKSLASFTGLPGTNKPPVISAFPQPLRSGAGKHFQKGTPATAPIPHREKPVSARSLLGPPNACLNPAPRIHAKAIERNAHDLVSLHDSGCRKPSAGHMMGVPHVSCQWR